jgi:putative ABC transport system permease protein
MNLWAIVKIAVFALGRNKTRSALTMLGIVIGVSAVIAMVSIGQGAQSMVQTQISSMGSNLLYVMPGNMMQGGASMGSGAAMSLTDDDVAAMEREVLAIAAATPVVNAQAQIVFGNQNWSVRVQGTNEKFPQIRNWSVSQGAFFTAADVRSAARVIVLGKTPAEKLFGGGDPVGQWVRVRSLPFRVVGVLTAKGQSIGQDQDDAAVVPTPRCRRSSPPGRFRRSIKPWSPPTVNGARRWPRCKSPICFGSATRFCRGSPTISWCATWRTSPPRPHSSPQS